MIVSTTSSFGVGGTFVDWSLHYLSGQTQYFSVAEQRWIDLVHQPVTDNNAHGHKRNHPLGIEQVNYYIDQLNHVPHDLHSFYMLENYLKDHTTRPAQHLLDVSQQHSIPVIYLHVPPHAVGYSWKKRNNIANNECHHYLHVWDQREKLALDLRPFDDSILLSDLSTANKSTIWVHCENLWQSPEHYMKDIMSRLSIDVNNSRYEKWILQADKWRQIQVDHTRFYRELDHIITCIVEGWHHPLEPLTLRQEAVIQHCLIYQHDLNLKTWGLDRFPNDTKLLHNLLEKNSHPVKNYLTTR